jgi:hypothetical protein
MTLEIEIEIEIVEIRESTKHVLILKTVTHSFQKPGPMKIERF